MSFNNTQSLKAFLKKMRKGDKIATLQICFYLVPIQSYMARKYGSFDGFKLGGLPTTCLTSFATGDLNSYPTFLHVSFRALAAYCEKQNILPDQSYSI